MFNQREYIKTFTLITVNVIRIHFDYDVDFSIDLQRHPIEKNKNKCIEHLNKIFLLGFVVSFSILFSFIYFIDTEVIPLITIVLFCIVVFTKLKQYLYFDK